MLEAIRQWLPWLGALYLLEGVVWVRRNRPLLCLDVTGEGRWLAPGLRWSGVLPARALFAPRAAAGPAPAAQAFDLGARILGSQQFGIGALAEQGHRYAGRATLTRLLRIVLRLIGGLGDGSADSGG